MIGMIGILLLASAFPADDAAPFDRIALYVGINDYQHKGIKDLRGCENDAQRIRSAMRSGYGFKRDRILLGKNATRANIGEAMRQLVEQTKKAKAKGKKPLVLFYYAGHGNKIQEGDIPDKESLIGDNSLTTWNTDPDGSQDIRDDDIGKLFAELQRNGALVIYIVDACHSASSYRSSDSETVRSLAGSNSSARGARADGFLRKGPAKPLFDWKWTEQPRHAAFAACTDVNLAGETKVNGQPCGKFTRVVVDLLESGRPYASYEDFAHALRQQFALTYPGCRQQPQFNISLDITSKEFFGEGRVPSHARVIRQADASTVTISAGTLHGVTEGARVVFYKDLTDLRELGSHAVFAGGAVESADPGTSDVILDKPKEKMPDGAVARVIAPRINDFSVSVDPALPQKFRDVLDALAREQKIRIAKKGEACTYALLWEPKTLALAVHAPDNLPKPGERGDAFVRLFPEHPDVDLEEFIPWLAQHHRLMNIRCNESMISVELSTTAAGEALTAKSGIPSVPNGSPLFMRIKNLSSDTTLHVGVVLFESELGEGERRVDGALAFPFTPDQSQAIAPGETKTIRWKRISSAFDKNASRARFKVIATDLPYPFQRLRNIATAPKLGAEDLSAKRGNEIGDVFAFLEDSSRGKRGVTPARQWATGGAVVDVGKKK